MNYSENVKHHVWAEKYRPNSLDDCALPNKIITSLKSHIDSGKIPNLLFIGDPGIGKTTAAHAICETMDYEVLYVNGSKEGRNIDYLRNQITQFCTTNSLEGKRKCVLIDEFDNVTHDTQLAMRAAIDEFTKYVTFILTGNYVARIIEPIRSRFVEVDFTISPDEKKNVAVKFLDRACMILDTEEIEYDRKVIASVIKKTFPDFRKCINELQSYSVHGKIDNGVIAAHNVDIREMIDNLKNKDFGKIRQWVFEKPTIDVVALTRKLEDNIYPFIQPQSVPEFIIIVARYHDMYTRAIDRHVTILAMLTEIMAVMEWK